MTNKNPLDSPVELTVEKLLPGGQGLARLNGEVILLPDALPEEAVRAKILGKIKGVKRGRIQEVLKSSIFRRRPDCPWAGRCGGCDFIHVEPGEALSLKAEAALGDLSRNYGLRPSLVESPRRERYRSRVTLHLALSSESRPRLGFFDADRNIIEINDCRLMAPELEALLPPIRAWANVNKKLLPGPGREIEIAVMKDAVGSDTAVCFSPPPADLVRGKTKEYRLGDDLMAALNGLSTFLEAQGLKETAILARPGRNAAPQRLFSGGPAFLTAAYWPEWDLSLKVRPGGFTQVNPEVNLLLVKAILEETARLAPGPKTALDLYAGSGNISIPLTRSGFQVTAVEQAAEGLQAARENAKGLNGLTFIGGQSEKVTLELARRGQAFRVTVLDPPRSGALNMAPLLAGLRPELILYVACHPAVLERDLPAFVSLGYGLEKLTAFDMFPRTSHLEALAVLRAN